MLKDTWPSQQGDGTDIPFFSMSTSRLISFTNLSVSDVNFAGTTRSTVEGFRGPRPEMRRRIAAQDELCYPLHSTLIQHSLVQHVLCPMTPLKAGCDLGGIDIRGRADC